MYPQKVFSRHFNSFLKIHRPRILTENGHLVFQSGTNHNITFRSTNGGNININGDNLAVITQTVSRPTYVHVVQQKEKELKRKESWGIWDWSYCPLIKMHIGIVAYWSSWNVKLRIKTNHISGRSCFFYGSTMNIMNSFGISSQHGQLCQGPLLWVASFKELNYIL